MDKKVDYKSKSGKIRGTFDKYWIITKEGGEYKVYIEIGNISVTRRSKNELKAFVKACNAIENDNCSDSLIVEYLNIFVDQFASTRTIK